MSLFGPKPERQAALRNVAKGGVPECEIPGYTHYKVKNPDGKWPYEYKTGMVIGPGDNDRDKFWREHSHLD